MPLRSQDIIAFIPTRSRDRAKTFYQDVLGLPLTSEDHFAMHFDANGILLRVVNVQALTPPPFTILGWQVPDIAATLQELQGAGVDFQRYEGLGQDELGIWTAPGGAKIAWFKDPDGNTLSLTQF